MTNDQFDQINIQPIVSSSSSCSTASSSSTSCFSTTNSESNNDVNIVINDLKQICATLSLLARQIDHVVDKIDSKFSNHFNHHQNDVNLNQSNLKHLKNFTKIINSSLNPSLAQSQSNYCNICSNHLNKKLISSQLYDSTTKSRIIQSDCNKLNQTTKPNYLIWKQEQISINNNNNNNHNNNEYVQKTSSLKPKCTRSKSQPAFKDSSLLTASNTSSNLNKYSILEANRLTSSPICNFNTNQTDNNNIQNNEVTNIPVTNLLSESSNGDSSFYEDQLDNELESLSNPEIIKQQQQQQQPTASLIKKEEKSKLSPTQKMKPNHHVSFNINNAIYTSKQETPIPISILKPLNQTKSILNGSNNCSNSNEIQALSSTGSSTNSSPLQSSLKKTQPNNMINSSSSCNEKEKCINNKSVRIDTKTTIL